MRKCDYCGADIPDGELKCPVCSHEVRLVPDYEPLENLTLGESIDNEDPYAGESEKDRYENEETYYEGNHRRHQERREYHLDSPAVRQQVINKRKKKIILSVTLTVVGVFAVIGLIFTAARYTGKKTDQEAVTVTSSSEPEKPDTDQLYDEAEELYQQKNYEKALEKIEAYLKELPNDQKGSLLKAKIQIASGNDAAGTTLLETIIKADPSCEEAYAILLPDWLDHQYYSKINKLMGAVTDQNIRAKFADYISEPPAISPGEGSYDDPVEVELKGAGDGTVYYTDDGSDPSSASKKYKSPIKLEEAGTWKIRAVFVNAKGVQSEIASASYEIADLEVEAPVIKTKSGTYETAGAIKTIIVEVPDGYTCYYAFDETPTSDSKTYTGPVDMILGQHTFNAVLQKDGSDKLSPVASIRINYKQTAQKPALKDDAALNSASKIDAVQDGDGGSDTVQDQDAAAKAAEEAAEDAAVKAVLSVWNPYSKTLMPGASRDSYNRASLQVSGLKDGTLKSELQGFLNEASAALDQQDASGGTNESAGSGSANTGSSNGNTNTGSANTGSNNGNTNTGSANTGSSNGNTNTGSTNNGTAGSGNAGSGTEGSGAN